MDPDLAAERFQTGKIRQPPSKDGGGRSASIKKKKRKGMAERLQKKGIARYAKR
jgi:hypothetical protein